ncbi:hypothetical protein [Roseomonas chloroacetimidivorans]|uniref:hypothetical protein n=1 Tax=Roseomonas chloroacetimidivorans TaxID=1766656 RepID=UPI003C78FAF4
MTFATFGLTQQARDAALQAEPAKTEPESPKAACGCRVSGVVWGVKSRQDLLG